MHMGKLIQRSHYNLPSRSIILLNQSLLERCGEETGRERPWLWGRIPFPSLSHVFLGGKPQEPFSTCMTFPHRLTASTVPVTVLKRNKASFNRFVVLYPIHWRLKTISLPLSFICVYVCICSYVCERAWRPEANIRCLPQSFSTLCFETGSLTEPEAHPFS